MARHVGYQSLLTSWSNCFIGRSFLITNGNDLPDAVRLLGNKAYDSTAQAVRLEKASEDAGWPAVASIQKEVEARAPVCVPADFPPHTCALRLLCRELGFCPAGLHDDIASEVFMR